MNRENELWRHGQLVPRTIIIQNCPTFTTVNFTAQIMQFKASLSGTQNGCMVKGTLQEILISAQHTVPSYLRLDTGNHFFLGAEINSAPDVLSITSVISPKKPDQSRKFRLHLRNKDGRMKWNFAVRIRVWMAWTQIQTMVAARISVISRNFFEIFNFVFREHFPRISRNFAKHEIETWAKISQFGETRNQNVGNILAILQERDEFFIKQM